MAHPVTAAASIPAPSIERRQARLNAAIALFRSEASASGYVVEEVRLRLPVPDVDVLPRVVIAQQSSSSGAPPPFPRAKQHRPLSSYPSPVSVPGEYPPAAMRDASFVNPPKRSYGIPRRLNSDQNSHAKTENCGAGFKRTVSGSVIFHPIPSKTTLSPRDGCVGIQTLKASSPKVKPLSSTPYLPTKEGRLSFPQNGKPNGQFWKTVIGGERGKQILQAAESMQRLRRADFGSIRRQEQKAGDITPVEISEPLKTSSKPLQNSTEKSREKAEQSEMRSTKPQVQEDDKDGEKSKENTHHINGHDIPESHVQLLLSSAVDISASDRKPVPKTVEESASGVSDESKLAEKTHEKSDGRPRLAKVTAVVSSGKYSRGRGSDRRTSGLSVARPYKCTKCPSSFDREGHLRVHILAVHEKKRPFVCQVCDASFGHSSSLLRHVRTVHQASPAVGSGKTNNSFRNTSNSKDSGSTKSDIVCDDAQDDSEKHFRCSACRMSFSRVALLNRHVAEKHPLQTSLSDSEDQQPKSS